MPELVVHRGRLAHCLGEPGSTTPDPAVEYFEDGALLVENGLIRDVGPAASVLRDLSPDVAVVDHAPNLIVPGFIDCHVHYPQIDVIASFGTQLLDWLERYTFPAESRFADPQHAQAVAETFLDELLKNGTTSALVFATVHAHSVDAIFSAALARRMRIAAGKVLMDRHCPEPLRDTPVSGYAESRDLLERWQGSERLRYAITPRFAATSSPDQLSAAGRLAAEFPDALVHTHLAENVDEVRWVHKLFPDARSYLDVYRRHGLLRERSVFAHCIHLDDQDHVDMAAHGGAIAFCPTSNLFLGSGLFDLARARRHGIDVGLGTDIGGGTSFSMLQTLSDAYKVLQLNRQPLSSLAGLYLATLGAAKTLNIDDKVGNFELGKEADFVVLDSAPTPLMDRRLSRTDALSDDLFVHMMLGDDRSVAATYVLGAQAWVKPAVGAA